jgi:hypothetical protein
MKGCKGTVAKEEPKAREIILQKVRIFFIFYLNLFEGNKSDIFLFFIFIPFFFE